MSVREVGQLEREPFLDEENANDKEEISLLTEEKDWNQGHGFDLQRLRQFVHSVRESPLSRLEWTPEYTQNLKNSFSSFLSFLVPSFTRAGPDNLEQLHETAYLDGLRGYACYAVFLSHYSTAYCNEVWHPYGEGGNHHFVQTNYFFQLPIIRLMFNGQASVCIFFVLSGYVLSYKPLKLIYGHDHDRLQSTMTSAIFKRWFRLFLPVLALFIINIIIVELGAFSWFDKFHADNPKMPPGMIEEYLPRGAWLGETIWNAYDSFFNYIRNTFFNWTKNGKLPIVDGHTWTLHLEFRCSCILFLMLQGTSKMRPNFRLAFFMIASYFCLFWDEWGIGTFLGGSAIADLDLRMRRRQSSSPRPESPSTTRFASRRSLSHVRRLIRPFIQPKYSQLRWGMVLILSLLILSYPTVGADKIFFYKTLSYYHPYSAWDLFYWESVASLLLVYTIGRFHLVQHFLEWPVSQYMGKTSFALYLMHGTVIKSLGHYLVIQTWLHVTSYSGWGYAWGILLPFLVVGPVTVVVSDWFWRGVDVPSVRLGKWIEGFVRDPNL